MISNSKSILLGVVSYCADIIPIWEGMRKSFRKANVDLDFVTFTSYDRQVGSLLNKTIDIAWNGPIAHVRVQKRASVNSLGMRDVDRGFKSYLVCQKDSLQKYSSLACLEDKKLATGSHDSPQAYLMPLHFLRKNLVNLKTIDIIRYDRDIGKHGDTALGEVEVMNALRRREVDVGFVSKLMWDRAVVNGFDTQGENLALLPFDIPGFNHCQFDALSTLDPDVRRQFQKGLFSMTWSDEDHRKIMILEGINKEWMEPEETGYDDVREALLEELPLPYPGPLHTPLDNPFKSLIEK